MHDARGLAVYHVQTTLIWHAPPSLGWLYPDDDAPAIGNESLITFIMEECK